MFYVVSSRGHVVPILSETLIIYAAGLALQKLNDTMKKKRKEAPKEERKAIKQKYTRKKQILLAFATVSVLAFLLVCKYQRFFIDNFNSLFGTSASYLSLAQPLGLSFFTLQAISYMADIHYDRCRAEKNPFKVFLYLSNMLTVVEGPVTRYSDISSQLNAPAAFNPHNLVSGAVRVTWGLIKKVVVADRCAILVNTVFDDYTSYSGFAIVLAAAFYTIQLYYEFSGVMDILYGLAEMMNLKLPENFNRPFFSKTINEFWQRWHISLGSWLKDYIFYPISLSRPFMSLSKATRGKFGIYYANLIPTSTALFFVWFCNGFWHGAGWKYIVYGLYYYVLMTLALFMEPLFAKFSEKLHIDRGSKTFGAFRVLRTSVIVWFGMLIFNAKDLTAVVYMVKSIFTGMRISSLFPPDGFGPDKYDYLVILIGVILVITVETLYEKGIDVRKKILSLPYAVKFILFLIMIFSVIIFGAYGEEYGEVALVYAGF